MGVNEEGNIGTFTLVCIHFTLGLKRVPLIKGTHDPRVVRSKSVRWISRCVLMQGTLLLHAHLARPGVKWVVGYRCKEI